MATSADAGYWKAGYALTTGSYWNNCSTFYRLGKAMANTQHSPLVAGKRHHVVLEYAQGHIRYQVDGQIILEAWDETPLPMKPDTWLALRTWDTHMTVHDLKIFHAAGVTSFRQ